ncbi:A/G-specific adenine glycosylase [Magnetovibrio sp. PR-2]|uniref:A/G-specific adenine glycosylase n=1 Tax=Magnetovibrio sp. PR-2 TaxID=3120356 RepID=UPI002FCE4881
MSTTPPAQLTSKLLNWFAQKSRADLPWRKAACGARDPYQVWLAEIMLQQTTVAAVIPYFETFTKKWPTVKDLANAKPDDVMHAWAGLGYYARARNMLKCAIEIADNRQGQFPRDEDDLLALPGVGPYTAAAIAAIAFNGPAAPVDGNVIRVLSRLYALEGEMPKNKGLVAEKAKTLLPKGESGNFAEALMDLGATVCKPKNPKCGNCPWARDCVACEQGTVLTYPKKAPKPQKRTRKGWVYWVENENGEVLLERRPEKGLLGGMMGFPGSPWQVEALSEHAAKTDVGTGWQSLDVLVTHTFTHFHLELKVMTSRACAKADGIWVKPEGFKDHALPSVMKKVAKAVLDKKIRKMRK